LEMGSSFISMAKTLSDEYSPEEAARRRDEVIRRMASTPPKPHSEMKIGKRKVKVSPKANRPEKRGRPDK
jgi:hypothetical protein